MIRPGKDLTWKKFFKRLIEEWSHDEISYVGASLTFYGLLAVFPFLIFLVALFSYFITPSQSQALIGQLGEVAPAQVTSVIADRIHALQSNPAGGLLTIGAVGAIWSAS